MDGKGVNIYKIDQLLAMKLVRDIWSPLPANFISNCWYKVGFNDPDTTDAACQVGRGAERETEELQNVASQIFTPRARIFISFLLNCDNIDCFQQPTLRDVVEDIAQEICGDRESTDISDTRDELYMLPSDDKQLHALSLAMRVVEAQDAPNFSALRCPCRLKR